ncbi:protein of unknown function [Taphrina deformans PYCC 5710]|uniref:E3 ubiquitin protein ligase n=1 Tax=Taphrina deformans (strain PYCC 5710 / ATCC 11124 / CBS 356.35 / IMI 108563 / JCM 9778 / NBRC 8474) TaxID=1097556 RepID=R4XEU7_TAPDE|nr:protein of unknown function [Taphrina deformans PYCC 5710]|eukprot:CCG84387.1 protein of unknown function [Taphrina deformans PYCC 5710]
MSDDASRAKRKAKTEDLPDKKQKVDSSPVSFEVQPEVENFQREALWRSLQDYKRRATSSQELLEKLRRKSLYHDDHLRIIDLWSDQLMDAIMIIAHDKGLGDRLSSARSTIDAHFLDSIPEFTEHLAGKKKDMLDSIVHALRNVDATKATEANIRSQLELENENIELAARIKLAEMQARKLQSEKMELEPKVTDLQERLASSQRKVDRQKSITLARIDQQARRGQSNSIPSKKIKVEDDSMQLDSNDNSDSIVNGAASSLELVHVQIANKELSAECSQLQTRLSEIAERNETLSRRLATLTIAEIEGSAPYRSLQKKVEYLRGHCEYLETRYKDVSVRLSDLVAERSIARDTMIADNEQQFTDVLAQLSKTEQDLTRVRSARDELHSALQLRKAQDDSRAASAREISELADTQATRIIVLEAEVNRLKQNYPETASRLTNGHSQDVTIDELWSRIEQLVKENDSLKNELPTMEQAFNQAHEQNVRKVMDLASAEDRVSRLQAEKSKADQKYFAAMKAKDQLSFELKAVKSQVAKSSDTILRIHEAEESLKTRIQALESQNAIHEQSCEQYRIELAKAEAKVEELRISRIDQEKQLADSRNHSEAKAKEMAQIINSKRGLAEELTHLKSRYEEIKELKLDNGVVLAVIKGSAPVISLQFIYEF